MTVTTDPIDICDFLCDIENKYNLFNYKYLGVCYWSIIRVQIHHEIAKAKNILKPDFEGYRKQRIVKQEIDDKKSKKKLSKKKYIVIPGEVRFKYNGKFLDPHTSSLLSELPANDTCIFEYTRPDLVDEDDEGISTIYRTNYVKHISHALKVLTYIHRIHWLLLSKKISLNLKKIEKKISEKYTVEISLVSIVLNSVLNYLSEYIVYKYLFLRINPEILFLVSSVGKEALIDAAKSTGCKVVEYQHGVIGPHNPVYEYKGQDVIIGKPDVLLVFSRYWLERVSLKKNIKASVVGHEMMHANIKKTEESKKSKVCVLLSGQPFVANELIAYCNILSNTYHDYRFIIRCHPNQSNIYKNYYRGSNNVFVDNGEVPVYELLAQSEYVVSGHSTALFESVALSCKTLIVASAYSKLHQELFLNTNCVMVDSPEEAAKVFLSVQPATDNGLFFDKPKKDILKIVQAL